jgi:[ribosomal protein S18]-alanine N-acetyltransferase
MIVMLDALDPVWVVDQVSVLESSLSDGTAWTRSEVEQELHAPDRTYIADVSNMPQAVNNAALEDTDVDHDDDCERGEAYEEATQLMRGYAGYWHGGTFGEVTCVNVAPRWRGKGVGMGLLQWIIEDARNRCLRRITLEVRPNNAPAKSLYRSIGFSDTARLKNYYATGLDADEMAIDLKPHIVGFSGFTVNGGHKREDVNHE